MHSCWKNQPVCCASCAYTPTWTTTTAVKAPCQEKSITDFDAHMPLCCAADRPGWAQALMQPTGREIHSPQRQTCSGACPAFSTRALQASPLWGLTSAASRSTPARTCAQDGQPSVPGTPTPETTMLTASRSSTGELPLVLLAAVQNM